MKEKVEKEVEKKKLKIKKNENFESKYIKRIWKIIKRKLKNKKTLRKFIKKWKTLGFSEMVRLG